VGKRVFSSTLLWSIVVATMWFARNTGAIVLGVLVSMLTVREFYVLMRGCGYKPFDKTGTLFGGLVTLAPWFEARFHIPTHLVLALSVVVFSIRLLGERTPENRMESLCSTLFGILYVSLLLQYFVRIVMPLPGDAISPNGRLLLCLWVIAASKFCDMGALLTGLSIGRHKMSPQISPKKTWEGAVGGVLASVAIGAALAWFGRDILPPRMTPLVGAVMAVPIALLGIVGDLVESVIKRRANIKDSAAIIPAMGGFFDMSDSLILTAPIGYAMITLVSGGAL
jgi:phosphatidate cytidylyltransferase